MPVSSVSLKTTKKTYLNSQLQKQRNKIGNGEVDLGPIDGNNNYQRLVAIELKKKGDPEYASPNQPSNDPMYKTIEQSGTKRDVEFSPGTAKTRGILSIAETQFSSGSITARRKDFIRRADQTEL